MTDGRLRALVTWTVEDPPAGARLGRLLGTVVDAAATVAALGTTTGARATPTWALPADPGAYVDLGRVGARGDAPWLPWRPGSRHRLQATQRAVLVDDGTGRRPPTPVPLDDLRIARARPRRPCRRSRHPTATLVLALEGAGEVEVDGAWLALAWIGHLAGWPEPTPT